MYLERIVYVIKISMREIHPDFICTLTAMETLSDEVSMTIVQCSSITFVSSCIMYLGIVYDVHTCAGVLIMFVILTSMCVRWAIGKN